MSESFWIPFGVIGGIVVFEMITHAVVVGPRMYAESWANTFLWAGMKIGFVEGREQVERPIRRKTLKVIKDL